MTAVVLFVVGSVLSGLAWSVGSLIFFRILQGLGGGMIMPAGRRCSRGPPGRSGWGA